MPACLRWNSLFIGALLGGMLLSAAAMAQTQPFQTAPSFPAQPETPPNMANQPFTANPTLPETYRPSPSAIDAPPANAGLEIDTTQPPADSEAPAVAPPVVEPVPVIRQPDPRQYTAVRLQGLDKVTTRRQQIKATIGTVTSFGNLEIVPHACWQSPPEERPESAALLEIWQWKPGEKPSFVFFGWMFASSPALSSLEHPIYDISVLKCIEMKKKKTEKKKPDAALPED